MDAKNVVLTDSELKVLNGIVDSEYNGSGNDVDNGVWIWSWSIRAKGIAKKSIPGVVASLVKKGLVGCDAGETRKEDSLFLTDLGCEVWKANQEVK